jgi:hypothetical protein
LPPYQPSSNFIQSVRKDPTKEASPFGYLSKNYSIYAIWLQAKPFHHSPIASCNWYNFLVFRKKKQYFAATFLDVSQAFYRVWHDGLLFKLKKILPASYFLLIKSYLSDQTFIVRQNSSYSNYFNILAGVPQGSDIVPFLYNVFTHDIPKTSFTELGTYADDIAIGVSHENPATASKMIQRHLNIIHQWTKRWKIKINESKSSFITFTLKKDTCPQVTMNNISIPVCSEVKYLGLILDSKLTWNCHIKNKRKALNACIHL